ncbi:MAG: cysteine peptidase family C39 domain-containing protein [Candidatus Woesearchaeota archaeon]
MKILDFPELRQTYEYDCGAKALQAVFAYFGLEFSEEVLIKEAKTSEKEGTTVINIEKTAEKYGFKVDSRAMEIKEVQEYINQKIPVILLLQAWKEDLKVNWEQDWQNGHYVVAIGYDQERIYFEDPAAFKRTFLSYAELEKRWHDLIQGKRYIRRGIALYGKTPKFDSKPIIHMD